MSDKYIELFLKEAETLSKEHKVMAIMCCGSQNYGLDIETSDFDTKAIIIPSFEDLVKGIKVSNMVEFEYGQCDVKDLRLYVEMLKKQGVNFIETLFTDHMLVNPRYKAEFNQLIAKGDDIATFDKERALKAMLGTLMQEQEKLKKSCESGDKEAANKHYINVFKCALMADKYIKGAEYKEVLDCSKIRVLRTKEIPFSEMQAHSEHLKAKTKEAVEKWVALYSLMADTSISDWLDTWVMDFLRSEITGSGSPAPADQGTTTEQEEKVPKFRFGKTKKR